jgi:hypothetical protein
MALGLRTTIRLILCIVSLNQLGSKEIYSSEKEGNQHPNGWQSSFRRRRLLLSLCDVTSLLGHLSSLVEDLVGRKANQLGVLPI